VFTSCAGDDIQLELKVIGLASPSVLRDASVPINLHPCLAIERVIFMTGEHLEPKVQKFGLQPYTDLEDGAPVLDADEGEELAKSFPSVSLVLGHNLDVGQGSLFITTR